MGLQVRCLLAGEAPVPLPAVPASVWRSFGWQRALPQPAVLAGVAGETAGLLSPSRNAAVPAAMALFLLGTPQTSAPCSTAPCLARQDDEGAEHDGIEIEDAAGDDLAAALGAAHL